MIMQGMTNAEAVQMIAVMFVIGTVTILLIVLGAVFWPETQRGAAAVSAWAGELGKPGNFREPADPSYVDRLIAVRGRATVIHSPDPIELVLGEVPWHSMGLDELIEGARYVVPVSPAPANAPTSPARHYSGVVDTASREYVGGHRAPVLVAA